MKSLCKCTCASLKWSCRMFLNEVTRILTTLAGPGLLWCYWVCYHGLGASCESSVQEVCLKPSSLYSVRIEWLLSAWRVSDSLRPWLHAPSSCVAQGLCLILPRGLHSNLHTAKILVCKILLLLWLHFKPHLCWRSVTRLTSTCTFFKRMYSPLDKH